MLEIYVDGSAINNENPNVPTLGGVGVCIIYNGNKGSWRVEDSKVTGYYYTVSNDMLEAPVSGLDLGNDEQHSRTSRNIHGSETCKWSSDQQ